MTTMIKQEMMDQLFEVFDEMLEKEKFDLVDEMLNWFNVNQMPTEFIIGILTVTNSWKEKLKMRRREFYCHAQYKFHIEYGLKKTETLLEGLE